MSSDDLTRKLIKNVLLSDRQVGGSLKEWQKARWQDQSGGEKGLAELIRKNSARLADTINRLAFGDSFKEFASSGGWIAESILGQVVERSFSQGGRNLGNLSRMTAIDPATVDHLLEVGMASKAYTGLVSGKSGSRLGADWVIAKRLAFWASERVTCPVCSPTSARKKRRGRRTDSPG